MISDEIGAELVEEVVFANIISDEIDAELVEEVVFANMISDEIDAQNAIILRNVTRAKS